MRRTTLETAEAGRGGWRAWWLPVAVLALLPGLFLGRGGLISEDGAALGFVEREGAFADWGQTQYGLRTARFWRPVVTTSLGVQSAMTGTAPVPLRLLNLGGHIAAALLLGVLALRLGASRVGALWAGLFAATFPHLGGNVLWVVGRGDSLGVPLFLGACVAALDRRATLAVVLTALACATKELGFLVPAWVALLATGRGDRGGGLVRRVLPVALAAGFVFVARRFALGEWLGGYAAVPTAGTLPTQLGVWARAEAASLAAAGLAFLVAGRGSRWRWIAALACALVAAAPLWHVLATGAIPAGHARILYLSDLGIGLAFAVTFRAGSHRSVPVRRICWLLAGALLLLRGVGATRDLMAWSAGAELAERRVAEARAFADELPLSDEPILAPFEISSGRAFVMAWGIADRFRAPFPATSRPVWPARSLWGRAESERQLNAANSLEDPIVGFGAGALAVPRLDVALLPEGDMLRVDQRVFEAAAGVDATARIRVAAAGEGEHLEVLLYTALGYEPATWVGGDTLSFFELLNLVGTEPLWISIVQSADSGATRAYFEIRSVDAATGAIRAVSAPVRIEWEPRLAWRVYPRGFDFP